MTHWKERATTRMLAELNNEWVNITRWVAMGDDGAPIDGGTGRQTELSQSEPSNLSFVLNDQDGRFTPDNATGLYYPDWRVGVLIRWAETVGARTFHWPDMWVETLETVQTFEVEAPSTVSAISDTFDRDETDQWGTAGSGQAWTTAGGVASDYNVGSGVGSIALTTTGSRNTVVGSTRTDVNLIFYGTTPQVATGDSYNISAIARWSDSNNFYIANAVMDTDGNVDVVIRKRVAAVTTNLITIDNLFTYAAGDLIGIRFQTIGTSLRCKVWNATGGVGEPDTWTTQTTDGELSSGQVGVRAERNTANTNAGLVIAVDDFTASPAGSSRTDRHVRVSCVDLMAKLNRAPEFISNLGAHIRGVGAATDDLVAYWPLIDAAGSTAASSGVGRAPLRQLSPAGQWLSPRNDFVIFGATVGPPGDDGSYVRFDVPEGTAPSQLPVVLHQSGSTVVAPAASGNLTLAAWIHYPITSSTLMQVDIHDATAAVRMELIDTGTAWTALFVNTTTFALLDGSGIAFGRWQFLTMQLDCVTGAASLWIDDHDPVTGTLSSTTSGDLTVVVVAGPVSGSVAHVQVYLGSAFDHDTHLAQYRAGTDGLAGQTVDQRLRTILNYAGVPDAQLDLQESDTPMPAARFAGQSPGSLLSAAAETGGGVLFTHTAEVHYQDRKHRFDL